MEEPKKIYKFYKVDNNRYGSDYCFCQRPCSSNYSLDCFMENGEILGFMSESLVSRHDNIKEIDLNTFMYNYVRPMIKELNELKKEMNGIYSLYIRLEDIIKDKCIEARGGYFIKLITDSNNDKEYVLVQLEDPCTDKSTFKIFDDTNISDEELIEQVENMYDKLRELGRTNKK